MSESITPEMAAWDLLEWAKKIGDRLALSESPFWEELKQRQDFRELFYG